MLVHIRVGGNSSVIEYRAFRNYDPPHVLRLWEQAGLGHGAALHLPNDSSFDLVNYSQTYFDPQGLIMACHDDRPVGFIHAGFGCSPDGDGLCRETGVICAVIVDPKFRRQGIGRELVSRAENYLRQSGATEIFAGPSPRRDPFFFGIYGGAGPAGFLESDAAASLFMTSVGYDPADQYAVTSRRMADRDPVSFRLTMIRRKWEVALVDRPDPCPWWWMSHFGRLDALYCVLVPKGGGKPAAGVTVVGLDAYMPSWQEQAIGMADLWVDESLRGQGFGQTLLIEVLKRLRKETITRATANVPEDDAAAMAVFRSAGFKEQDRGVVYRAKATS